MEIFWCLDIWFSWEVSAEKVIIKLINGLLDWVLDVLDLKMLMQNKQEFYSTDVSQ